MENNVFPLVPATYSVAAEFGLPVPPEVMIAGFAPGHPAAPPIDTEYVFMADKLRDVLAFWQSAEDRALKIIGDPGCGKTSIVEQFHARLRWPIYKVSCSPDTEARDLIGQLQPMADGTLKWVDGPVLRAAREGTSVLLDEFNILEPGAASGLNMLMEGYSIAIPSTGEIVTPAKGFKVFATENPVDSRLSVAGRNVQDAANDDRWMVTTADYLPAALEEKAVSLSLEREGVHPDVAAMLATQVVSVANSVRAAYRDENSMVDKPMSTRVAKRWARLIRRFNNVKHPDGPVVYALRRAFQMNAEMDKVVTQYARVALGTGTSNARA